MYAEGDYEYILVHGDKDNNKPIEKNGERVKEYGISLYRNLNLWNDFKAIIQAVRIIRKEQPDLLHCHSAKGGVVGRVAGFLTRTKTFYTPHAFSFLSTQSRLKRKIYLFIERSTKLNAWLWLVRSQNGQWVSIWFIIMKTKPWYGTMQYRML